MDGSIELSAEQRKVLLTAYRQGKDVRAACRVSVGAQNQPAIGR